MIQYSVGANFVLFVTNCLRDSGMMKGYPDNIWTVRIWIVKFPGDIWTVEIWRVKIWTVKTGLGVGLGLGLGLVLTVQILTVHIKISNRGTAAPHFSTHVYCDQMARWIKMPHCVRWEPISLHKGHSSPQFSAGVCCGQMAGRIKMQLGTEVGFSAGDTVLDDTYRQASASSQVLYCGHFTQYSHLVCSVVISF